MPETATNASTARPGSRPDNRPDNRIIYTLLTLVLAAIVVIGWFAFFTAPLTPIKRQAVDPVVKPAKGRATVTPAKAAQKASESSE